MLNAKSCLSLSPKKFKVTEDEVTKLVSSPVVQTLEERASASNDCGEDCI